MTPAVLGALCLFAFAASPVPPPAQATTVRVEAGVGEHGLATAPWLAILRRRLSPDRYEAVAGIRKPLTAEEAAWAALIRSRVGEWQGMVAAVARPFSPVPAPEQAVIVLGNRGGDDAFTHDARTIGFDLAALQAAYGDAARAENAARIDRLFRHELTHLLEKAWMQEHPFAADTPLARALWDIWAEGLGNYYSLSGDWRSAGGQRPERAARALAELEPRLVARLAALACATPEAAGPLTADLSSGRFDRKWGAVTMAVWLDAEPDGAAALRGYVEAGPGGFWDLAERHLPEGLRPVLREARAAESLCARR